MLSSIQQLANSIIINDLPSVLLTNRNNLPDTPGVYFIESRGSILYVGMSENSLQHRFIQHHRTHQIESQFVNPKIYFYTASEDSVRDLESALIHRFNPLLQNTQVKPYTREDIGTEILPQVEDGEIHIKIETVLELLSSFKDVIKELDHNILRMREQVERLEDKLDDRKRERISNY